MIHVWLNILIQQIYSTSSKMLIFAKTKISYLYYLYVSCLIILFYLLLEVDYLMPATKLVNNVKVKTHLKVYYQKNKYD